MQIAARFGFVRGRLPERWLHPPDSDSGGFAGVGARPPFAPHR
jgi:hypothetical protein